MFFDISQLHVFLLAVFPLKQIIKSWRTGSQRYCCHSGLFFSCFVRYTKVVLLNCLQCTKISVQWSFLLQGFRADPRFLTARDKAYKRVVNDTSIFKVRVGASIS
jgi:hypothetical protein